MYAFNLVRKLMNVICNYWHLFCFCGCVRIRLLSIKTNSSLLSFTDTLKKYYMQRKVFLMLHEEMRLSLPSKSTVNEQKHSVVQ